MAVIACLPPWPCPHDPAPVALLLWSCFHSPSLVACMWQQWQLTLASPPLAVAYAGCVCGEEAPSGLAGLGVHFSLSSWVCVPEKRPACPVGASVGKTSPLRKPCPREQASRVLESGPPPYQAVKPFSLGGAGTASGPLCSWGGGGCSRRVFWLMAFQQRVSAGFSLWRKETTVGGAEGMCSLVEVGL